MKSPTKQELISWGRAVLLSEAKALKESGERLGDTFGNAVEAILNCRGKVVVTGLGKSGHIARKIASTFSSTGTPAVFLHPTEAQHGDFGLLSENDCLVAIAFGGETAEVVDVARFARRLSVKIIALTGKSDSSLGKLADVVVDGAVSEEACSLNLAPTSSSTLALALGDALAVACSKARGFGEQDFAKLHPGGSIGRKLSMVSDHMRTDYPVVAPEADFHLVLERITAPNFGVVAVVNAAGKLMGVITDGDVRRSLLNFGGDVLNKKASDLMNKTPKTISSQALAVDAVRLMEGKITSLFVCDPKNPDRPVGLIRMHDLLAAKVV